MKSLTNIMIIIKDKETDWAKYIMRLVRHI